MFAYVPKLHHAMIALLLSIILIALCAKAQGWVLRALLFGAFMFGLMSVIVMWMLILQAYDTRLEKMIELARLYTGMDEEARQAFAFQFPTMQYRMRHGEVRAFFEDTNVPIDLFRVFLQTSNDRYISPRRDWCNAEKPEWAWIEIKDWLESHNRIVADSAAGPHSWLWQGSAYSQLMAYWMSGRRLIDMSERIYAYDSASPPPLETTSDE